MSATAATPDSVAALPRGLLAAALLFWGWQIEMPEVGLAVALVVETPRWLRVRLDLGPADLARIADLCTLLIVGLVGLLAATRSLAVGVLDAAKWFPAVLAPIVCAQFLTADARIPLSALSRSLRKRRVRDPSVADPPVDVSAVYLALCVIGAGAANARGESYYLGLVGLAAWTLAAIRPRYVPRLAWAAAFAAAAGLGYGVQSGLTQLQSAMEAWVIDFQLRGVDADPYRNATDIGAIGRLKSYDAIVLRVYPTPGADAVKSGAARLLHRASFTVYGGTIWRARSAPMQPLASAGDGTTWPLAAGDSAGALRVATRLENGRALLALPAGTLRIGELPAVGLKRNVLAAVQADVGGDWTSYVAVFGPGTAGYADPGADDLALPQAERPAFDRLADELGLPALAPAAALRRIEAHFARFEYSTYRPQGPPDGATALADFLERTRSGHCEYFAAATTLALRAAGIPARYATGFAAMEYSALEEAYLVRARHAHAWTRAWIDGRWIDVDTTPPAWLEAEAQRAPPWEGVYDVLRWLGFKWSQRDGGPLESTAFVLVGVLAALLAWRVASGRRLVRRERDARPRAAVPQAGRDSEFYAVEQALAARGSAREAGEPLARWAARAAQGLDATTRSRLLQALALHERHRFDPRGLAPAERDALRRESSALARALAPERV